MQIYHGLFQMTYGINAGFVLYAGRLLVTGKHSIHPEKMKYILIKKSSSEVGGTSSEFAAWGGGGGVGGGVRSVV